MVKLIPGEVHCKKCNGIGLIKGEFGKNLYPRPLTCCEYCLGEGKLDWIYAINGQCSKSKLDHVMEELKRLYGV